MRMQHKELKVKRKKEFRRTRDGGWSQFRSEPNLDDLGIFHAHFRTHRFAPHVHEQYAFGIMECGAEALQSERNKGCIVSKGGVIALNPNETHAGKSACREGWTFRMIYVNPSTVGEIAEEIRDGCTKMPLFEKCSINDPILYQRFCENHRRMLNPATNMTERQECLIEIVSLFLKHQSPFAQALEGYDETLNGKDPRISDAIEHINEHYQNTLCLDDMAEKVGLSKFTLIRKFKRVLNMTPGEYLINIRIKKGRELLLKGENIAAIAHDLGFYDQSHFHRNFLRITGTSPGEFAQL